MQPTTAVPSYTDRLAQAEKKVSNWGRINALCAIIKDQYANQLAGDPNETLQKAKEYFKKFATDDEAELIARAKILIETGAAPTQITPEEILAVYNETKTAPPPLPKQKGYCSIL